jgi:hypothetical protein
VVKRLARWTIIIHILGSACRRQLHPEVGWRRKRTLDEVTIPESRPSHWVHLDRFTCRPFLALPSSVLVFFTFVWFKEPGVKTSFYAGMHRRFHCNCLWFFIPPDESCAESQFSRAYTMNSLISQTTSCSWLRSLARWFWLSSFYAAHASFVDFVFVSLLQWFAKWLANESDLMPFVISFFKSLRCWPIRSFGFVVFVQCRTCRILCKKSFAYYTHFPTLLGTISHQSLTHGCSCRADP